MNASSARMMVDRKANKWSPFNRIIGQEDAVDALADLCFKGLCSPEHAVGESIVLVGPPSSGKTTIVKVVANQVLNIVSALLDGTQISKPDHVIDGILTAWAKSGRYLQPIDIGDVQKIVLPSMVVFIDEIHALDRKAQDGLLKATERNDGMLFGKSIVLDCRKVFWIAATTDWGKLCTAFRTRFRRIDLVAPTFEQVVQMVMQQFHYDLVWCVELVKYGGVIPRECFSFVRSVEESARRNNTDIQTAIRFVASREGIDNYGMRVQRLRILTELKKAGKDGCLLRSLVYGTGCQSEDLLNHWLPSMQVAPPGQEPLVLFDGRYYITQTGLQELDKRGL